MYSQVGQAGNNHIEINALKFLEVIFVLMQTSVNFEVIKLNNRYQLKMTDFLK